MNKNAVAIRHTQNFRPARHSKSYGKIKSFIENNAVLCIAVTAAILSSLFVKPDAEYINYLDFKTLSCLFSTLAVICALRNIHFFSTLAEKIVVCTGNLRVAVTAIVYITFIGSMLIANDMALLTFLPLGFYVMKMTGMDKYTAYVFILQNIAANLGGMLTPFGNPQNLYLFEAFKIPSGEFVGIMLIPFSVSVLMITVCSLLLPASRLSLTASRNERLPAVKTMLYIILFALSILAVFRVVPYYICMGIIIAVLMIIDRSALRAVDYPLLLTFTAFFIFAGNMARIDIIHDILSALMEKSTLLYSVLSCQVISNVPSAILLSQFTDNYPSLLIGVNIGGTGTLIASLASLITFREYTKEHKDKTARYLVLFTVMNFIFLSVLVAVSLMLGY